VTIKWQSLLIKKVATWKKPFLYFLYLRWGKRIRERPSRRIVSLIIFLIALIRSSCIPAVFADVLRGEWYEDSSGFKKRVTMTNQIEIDWKLIIFFLFYLLWKIMIKDKIFNILYFSTILRLHAACALPFLFFIIFTLYQLNLHSLDALKLSCSFKSRRLYINVS